ncbi:MAG TPA: ATP-binding protein [Gammaproteobacteria bacterium]
MLANVALRNLMGQASAGSLETVYRTALRCVQEALDVRRASLLVLDAGGAMRFVAWSDLSEAYRRTVDGHSPWRPDETAAAPLLVPDVERDDSLARYLPVFRAEAIRALAFVPLQFGPRLLGKFMLYYREPHRFSAGEVEVAQQIADHVAFALEHHRIAVALEAKLAAERELRQRAESEAAQRRAHESRLHLALAAGHMGAWDWDLRTNEVDWTPELEAIHGLGRGQFERTLEGAIRRVHPADAAYVEAAVKAAIATPGAVCEVEYRIRRTDGAIRWIVSSGRVLGDADGTPSRMVGVCRDVTQRKRADEANALLADVSRVLATTLDPDEGLEQLAVRVVPNFADYCITYAVDDKRSIRTLGAAHCNPKQSALVESFARDVPVSIEDRTGPGAAIRRGQPELAMRVVPDRTSAATVRDPNDGRTLEPRSLMIVPLNARGRSLGAVMFAATDDSGRLFGEEDLANAVELANRAALLLDNARLYAAAQSAVRERDDMIAMVSHDLRGPIQSISAAAAALRSAPRSDDDVDSIESIALASTTMRRLVEDLLTISRIEAGRLPLDKKPVQVTELADEVFRLFQPQAQSRAVRLQRRIVIGLPAVLVDRHRMLQVLSNLLGNALKFVPAGGVITLGAALQDGLIRISVTDTGVGIAPDLLERVFDRFCGTDPQAGGGAGLGLAVAKGIVEAHGGRIGVESRRGVGTTFHFTLEPREAHQRRVGNWGRRVGP